MSLWFWEYPYKQCNDHFIVIGDSFETFQLLLFLKIIKQLDSMPTVLVILKPQICSATISFFINHPCNLFLSPPKEIRIVICKLETKVVLIKKIKKSFTDSLLVFIIVRFYGILRIIITGMKPTNCSFLYIFNKRWQ